MARVVATVLLCLAACSARAPVAYEARETYKDGAELRLTQILTEITEQPQNSWRDRAAQSRDAMVRAMVEIGRGDSDKHEFDISKNSLVVDRVLPDELGGYPVNYGFVPRTFAYDEDPLDVLVLGPRMDPGTETQGKLLAVLHMEDEKGPDPKLLVVPVDEAGNPVVRLRQADKLRLAKWFESYKKGRSDGRWAHVTGWGDVEDAERILRHTSAFFDRVAAKAR